MATEGHIRFSVAGGAVLAVFAVTASLNVFALRGEWDSLRPVVSGDPAPPFELPRIEAGGVLGSSVSLESLRGNVVLIDFWATYCKPCRKSMPLLHRIESEYRDRGFVLLSLNTEGPDYAMHARAMADQLSPGVTLVSDVEGDVSETYGATTIPYFVLVDRAGQIRLTHRGFPGEESLAEEIRDAVEPLLDE